MVAHKDIYISMSYTLNRWVNIFDSMSTQTVWFKFHCCYFSPLCSRIWSWVAKQGVCTTVERDCHTRLYICERERERERECVRETKILSYHCCGTVCPWWDDICSSIHHPDGSSQFSDQQINFMQMQLGMLKRLWHKK